MEKAPEAFRTISEVAQDLDIPQHVLRFWESRFREIRPMKRGGGRRYYRPEDVMLLRGVRHLLYGEGYTIRGVQRLLREQGVRFVQNVWQPGAPQPTLPANEEAAGTGGSAPHNGAAAITSPEENEGERAEPNVPRPATGSAPPIAAVGLAPEDRRRLQAVLRDLTECCRLLDAAVAEPSLPIAS